MDIPYREIEMGEGGSPVYSVRECLAVMKEALRRLGSLRVRGEVSSISFGPTGHAYFTLRDSKEKALLRCVMWRSSYGISGVALEQGMEVVVSGVPDIYDPNGGLSLVVRTVEPAGKGALHRAYLELKGKLETEGLFDPDRKRSVPAFPCRVGVITSLRSGTVVHDLTNNLRRSGFRVLARDSRVEGKEAVHDLLDALSVMARIPLDVLVLMRGGGSLESLQAFDNEALVRAVRAFPAPVIAAIGHHADVPLAALAADVSVSTPTAAARELNRTWERGDSDLRSLELRLLSGVHAHLRRAEARIADLAHRARRGFDAMLQAVEQYARAVSWRVRELAARARSERESAFRGADRICTEMRRAIARGREEASRLGKEAEARSPERQLRLGYALVRSRKGLVRTARSLVRGEEISVSFVDGAADAVVRSVRKRSAL